MGRIKEKNQNCASEKSVTIISHSPCSPFSIECSTLDICWISQNNQKFDPRCKPINILHELIFFVQTRKDQLLACNDFWNKKENMNKCSFVIEEERENHIIGVRWLNFQLVSNSYWNIWQKKIITIISSLY